MTTPNLPLSPAARAALQSFLDGYEPDAAQKGRAYLSQITRLRQAGNVLQATVSGTHLYDVTLHLPEGETSHAQPRAFCTCPMFARSLECKHVAGVLLRLCTQDQTSESESSGDTGAGTHAHAMDALLRQLGNASVECFAVRVADYDTSLASAKWPVWARHDIVSGWWTRVRAVGTLAKTPLVESVERFAARALADQESMAQWAPEREGYAPGLSGRWAELMQGIFELEQSQNPYRFRSILLGPLDFTDRHWNVMFDEGRQAIRVREIREGGDRHGIEFALALSGTVDGGLEVAMSPPQSDMLVSDAKRVLNGRLYGLRALDVQTRDPNSAITRGLAAFFASPGWEKVLQKLSAIERERELPVRRELSDPLKWRVEKRNYGQIEIAPLQKNGPKAKSPYKPISYTLLAELADQLDALDRDVFERTEALGERATTAALPETSATTFAVLRVLAESGRAVSDTAGREPIDLVYAPLRMQFATTDGTHAAEFFVGEHRANLAALAPHQFGRRTFPDRVVYQEVNRFFAVTVPRALVPWMKMELDRGGSLQFPAEAASELKAKLLPLKAAGVSTMPDALRGKPRAPRTAAALSLEWRDGGYAEARIYISLLPEVPLVEVAAGAKEINFEARGTLYEVTRDFDAEISAASELAPALKAILRWDDATRAGVTTDYAGYVALLRFLQAHPEVRVESKKGRTPKVLDWESAERTLKVSQSNGWFSFRGDITQGGVSVPFAAVLEAVRTASGYIAMANGDLMTLPSEAAAQLAPLAFAAELGGVSESAENGKGAGGTTVHAAFLQDALKSKDAFSLTDESDAVLEASAKLAARSRVKKRASLKTGIEHGTLRAYQAAGIKWALDLAEWAPGAVLADDMGLGKTVQAAAVLRARAKGGPALVVTPASVGFNWKSELARFVPSLNVTWFHEDKALDVATMGPGDVLVISYGKLQSQAARFAEVAFETVVLDEAQFVKNTDSLRAEAVRGLSKRFTLALSGTPMENHLGELWSIFDVVFPGLLSTRERFHARYRKPIESGGDPARLAALKQLAAPFVMRRTRTEVLKDLPSQETIVDHVELDASHAKKYEALRKASELQFVQKDDRLTQAQRKIQILAALTKLRQLACDASLVDKTHKGTSAKLLRINEICEAAREQGDAVLVFSQFTTLLTKIEAELQRAGLKTMYLDGGTDAAKRGDLVARFQAGEADVFCISLGAGGTGLNLTRATYVVHADPWWNPAVEDQATARAHRMGQTRPVTAYKLVARGTIEEAILAMQDKKRALVSSVMDGTAAGKAGSIDELLALLQSVG